MSLEKILIVEDNEVIRRALEIQLQRFQRWPLLRTT